MVRVEVFLSTGQGLEFEAEKPCAGFRALGLSGQEHVLWGWSEGPGAHRQFSTGRASSHSQQWDYVIPGPHRLGPRAE